MPAPHVGVAGRQPDPGARRERDHRRRRAFITAATAAVTAAGSTAPSILTRTPPDSAISIEPAKRLGGRWPSARLPCHRLRADLDRQQLRRRRPCRPGEPLPPFEQLVGVHVVPPRHDRDRCARLERLRHQADASMPPASADAWHPLPWCPLRGKWTPIAPRPSCRPVSIPAEISARRRSPEAYVVPSSTACDPAMRSRDKTLAEGLPIGISPRPSRLGRSLWAYNYLFGWKLSLRSAMVMIVASAKGRDAQAILDLFAARFGKHGYRKRDDRLRIWLRIMPLLR